MNSCNIFVRMLAAYCDQNNSYGININGYQVRKINAIRNVIFSKSRQLHFRRILAKHYQTNESDSGRKKLHNISQKMQKLRQQHYQVHRSDNRKKGIFRLFQIFL